MSSESDAVSKAQGLYETFQQGNVVLGLVCALEITGELEVLNMSLQSRTQTLDDDDDDDDDDDAFYLWRLSKHPRSPHKQIK